MLSTTDGGCAGNVIVLAVIPLQLAASGINTQ